MTVAASRNCKNARKRSPRWKNDPKALDGVSEAAVYVKTADPYGYLRNLCFSAVWELGTIFVRETKDKDLRTGEKVAVS